MGACGGKLRWPNGFERPRYSCDHVPSPAGTFLRKRGLPRGVPYDRLAARLRADRPTPSLSTLPDGSVDRFCTLSAGGTEPVTARETFGREVRAGRRKAYRLHPETTEPGGQCVNTAQQAHDLGADVTCYGHLDHPVHADLPFEAVSMGEPATVSVVEFDDGDVMLVEPSADILDWSLAELRAVAPLADVLAVDAVCCANWLSLPGMGAAFHALAERELPRVPFVFDPGDVVGCGLEELRALRAAIGALQSTVDVVFNANLEEVRAVGASLPDPPTDDADTLAAIREATGVAAAVLHGEERAVAATADSRVTVPNLAAGPPERHTGGGDRFGAGLAYGLALDWDWELALACGNACAVHYVRTGETGDADAVAASAEDLPYHDCDGP